MCVRFSEFIPPSHLFPSARNSDLSLKKSRHNYQRYGTVCIKFQHERLTFRLPHNYLLIPAAAPGFDPWSAGPPFWPAPTSAFATPGPSSSGVVLSNNAFRFDLPFYLMLLIFELKINTYGLFVSEPTVPI